MKTPTSPARSGGQTATIYNRVFWMSYAANAIAVTANALTFRFAEFVAFLGGSEVISGYIVGTGITAALLVRLGLGQAIDRYGTRYLWLLATLLFVSGCSGFFLHSGAWWELYASRVLFSVGLAGMFSCSMVHIQNQVPAKRRTEVIASLGSSGFLGMITGPLIGDVIFRAFPEGPARFYALFAGAAVLGCVYFALVICLTSGDRHTPPHETPAVHRLIFRFWPGPIVFVAMMIGINFTVISVFLTRFATHLGLRDISTFFMGYAAAAFTFRIGTRTWGESVGRHRMALIGLAGVGCGQFMFLFVSQAWHLLFPALSCGFGHALLFPAVVSLGAGAFPPHYRGTGTTLVLGFTELGTVLSAPILGGIIDYFHGTGFSQMFAATGSTAFAIAGYYALTAARCPDKEQEWETPSIPAIKATPVSVAIEERVPAGSPTPETIAVRSTTFGKSA